MSKGVGAIVFSAVLWRYEGPAAWHFITLPKAVAAKIRGLQVGRPRRPGFGSVRVMATVGNTTWPTSLFPDTASGSYLLPVKVAVRRLEGLLTEQKVTVRLQVVG